MRDFRLDSEYVIQVAIVLLCPDASIGASVHQLRIYVHFPVRTPHRSLEHVGDTQRITDLVYVLLAAILHDAGAADHFQIGNFCQLGQDVVLHAVGKEPVLFLVA